MPYLYIDDDFSAYTMHTSGAIAALKKAHKQFKMRTTFRSKWIVKHINKQIIQNKYSFSLKIALIIPFNIYTFK